MNGFVIDINKVRDITTLVGKELNQYVDKELLHKLMKCYKGEGDSFNKTILVLKNMYEVCKENRFKVAYQFSKNNPYNLCRYYATNNLSLGSLARDARHALCKDTYVDIDAVCSQQSLLVSLCTNESYDKPYDAIKDYVENRSQRLKEIMDFYEVDRETAKQLMTTLTNCGTLKSWANEHKVENQLMIPFLDKYKKQMELLGDYIIEMNPELIKEIRKMDSTAWKASYVSLWYQTYERMILDTIIYFLVEGKNILDGFVPCHDGIMIPKKDYHEGLEKEIEDYINSNLDLNLRFIKKPMDEPYEMKEVEKDMYMTNDMYDEFITSSVKDFFNKYLSNEMLQADTLMTLKPIYNKFICCSDKIYYTNRHGVWVEDTLRCKYIYETIKEALFYLINKCLSRLEDEHHNERKKANGADASNMIDDKYKPIYKMIRQQMKNISTSCYIKKHVENICRMTSLNRADLPFDKNPYLFALNDKVLDMTNLNHIFFRDIKETDYISLTTGYHYEEPNKLIQEELDNILKTIQPNPEVLKFVKWIFARCLLGISPEKIYQLNGSGRNGKGLWNTFNSKVFGKYYSELNSGAISTDMKVGACPELANLKGKRFVVVSEINAGTTANSATLKLLSGGDNITARNLYEKDEISYKAQFGLFIEINGKLKCSMSLGNAMMDRIYDIIYGSKFTDNVAKVNPDKHIYLRNELLKNDSYFNDKAVQLLHMYVEVFRELGIRPTVPEFIKQSTKNYFTNEQESFSSWFSSEYVFKECDEKEAIETNNYSKLKDILQVYRSSEAYKNLDKTEKALFTINYLRDKLINNYQDLYVERTKHCNKNYYSILLNYTRKVDDEENQEKQEKEL